MRLLIKRIVYLVMNTSNLLRPEICNVIDLMLLPGKACRNIYDFFTARLNLDNEAFF